MTPAGQDVTIPAGQRGHCDHPRCHQEGAHRGSCFSIWISPRSPPASLFVYEAPWNKKRMTLMPRRAFTITAAARIHSIPDVSQRKLQDTLLITAWNSPLLTEWRPAFVFLSFWSLSDDSNMETVSLAPLSSPPSISHLIRHLPAAAWLLMSTDPLPVRPLQHLSPLRLTDPCGTHTHTHTMAFSYYDTFSWTSSHNLCEEKWTFKEHWTVQLELCQHYK